VARRGCKAALAAVLMLAATAALAGGPEALPLSTLGSPKQEGVSALTYPATRVLPLVEEKFGQKVADPYRWLENDVRTDREVEDWVAAENRATDSYLATLPGRQILKDRMKALFNYERYSVPRKASSLYFYARNSGLQNQSPLYVREGLGGKARLLIDPNSWAKDGTTALAEWEPSPDGRKLVYAVQDGGSDWRTLHVIDVATGSVLPDRIEWVKFSRLEWDRAGEGFFYSRFPAPEQGREYLNADLNNTVYYHRLGTDQSADRLVYRTPAHPKWNHAAQVSDDGQWLVITTSEGTDPRYEIVAINLADPKWKPRTIVSGMKNEWKFVGSVASRMWFVTDLGAPRSRLVTLDAARRGRAPQEIVPQRADTLAGASLVGRRIILAYMSNAQSVVEMVELDGKLVGPIPLPGIGTAAGFGGKAGDPETFFSFSGFTTPGTIYRFNTDNQAVEEFARPRLAFNPDDYEEEQLFYASKDGTKVPMFIVRKKSLARALTPAPTLLYGYGGFNISILPGYSAMRMAWLEQGGVIAVANLRGGGEYGREWHEAGRLANKQNVFDDFIAAGEYLIDNHYTGKDQLAIEGRSNGGLLVGAVVNQRPDLFAAALPAVGVMDMLRFDQFTAGRYWVDDYGYPDREADFNILRGYSPYHNIRSGVDYPAILVTTADTDDRVVPGHSFKWHLLRPAGDVAPAGWRGAPRP
jgi:prolyl oligopeptidase